MGKITKTHRIKPGAIFPLVGFFGQKILRPLRPPISGSETCDVMSTKELFFLRDLEMLGSCKTVLQQQKSLAQGKKWGVAGSGRDPRIRTRSGCRSGIRSRGPGFFFVGAELFFGAENPIPGQGPGNVIFWRRKVFFLGRKKIVVQTHHLP